MFGSKRRDRSTTLDSYVQHGWDALEDEDPEAAEHEAREALKIGATNAEAKELLGAALVDQDRFDEALPVLQEAAKTFPGDPSIRLDIAIALLGAYRLREAARRLRALVSEDAANADAHYWLGVASELLGDDVLAASSYATAARLDPDCYTAPARVPREEFESLLAAAIDELPAHFRRHIGEEVPIHVTDFPSRTLARGADPALSPLILGLFDGAAVTERSVFDSGSLPPRIIIFQRNVERVARTRDEFIEELRVTLLHELGHYLGLDEEELAERGLE